jgi:hypothetical protein
MRTMIRRTLGDEVTTTAWFGLDNRKAKGEKILAVSRFEVEAIVYTAQLEPIGNDILTDRIVNYVGELVNQ